VFPQPCGKFCGKRSKGIFYLSFPAKAESISAAKMDALFESK
jgi:hypothetical protein